VRICHTNPENSAQATVAPFSTVAVLCPGEARQTITANRMSIWIIAFQTRQLLGPGATLDLQPFALLRLSHFSEPAGPATRQNPRRIMPLATVSLQQTRRWRVFDD